MEEARMRAVEAGYVVVDLWHVKPGKEDELKRVLAQARQRFRAYPGIISVDYAHLDGDESRYLVVFRYTDQETREAFVSTDDLKSTMARLSHLWALAGPVYKGAAAIL
jgi:quinol monooxygenase YgiN